MAFPETIRDIVGEMYLADGWQDITSDLLMEPGINIVRARRDESSVTQPTSCVFTLDNESGDYSPRNPVGQWYGYLGDNVPVRIGVAAIRDTFTRTVANSWGTSDSNHVWTTTLGVGSVAASDWNVAAGVGTHTIGNTSAYRVSQLLTLESALMEIAVTVTLGFTNVTGGAVEPANILLRGTSDTNYYMVRLSISTAEAVTIAIHHYDGTILAAAVSTGLTHSAAQSIRVRANIEGNTIRAKAWAAASSEPYGWQVTAYDTTISGAGWGAIRSGVASGNSNIPVTFSYDNLIVSYPRASTEISKITPQWDSSGNFVTSHIESFGILRRFLQGESAIGSSMRRGIVRRGQYIVAYWPCEDTGATGKLSSGLPGGIPMDVVGTGTSYAADSSFACSDPIAQPGTATWYGRVPSHAVVDRSMVRFLMSVPDGGITTQTVLSAFLLGTAYRIDVDIDATGALRVAAYGTSGASLGASLYNSFAVNGSPRWLSLEYWQSIPGTIAVNLATLEPGAATGLQLSLGGITFAGTIGVTTAVQVYPIGSVGIGHISVQSQWVDLFDLGRELAAWNGELAVDRIIRLGEEESVAVNLTGDATVSPPMGPIRSLTLSELFAECELVDGGTFYEALGDNAIAYRTLESTYNQDAATVTIDYPSGELAPPFIPVDDDQSTRNDITAKRLYGGEVRAELTTGRLSTLLPSDGGVGRYDTNVTVNNGEIEDLGDIAYWMLKQGTIDESRYPTIAINLANPDTVSAALEPEVMGINIDDRLDIVSPKAVQSPGDIRQVIRGYSEHIANFTHYLQLVCKPESGYHVLDFAGTARRLDTANATLTASITDSAASFQVTTVTLWTTEAGDMPVSITIGGEEMSVGAIAGTSSPQTFSSVTRSVNNVTKAHDAGSPVHVTYPARLALWSD